jgi:SAM-dependent methyltransferase
MPIAKYIRSATSNLIRILPARCFGFLLVGGVSTTRYTNRRERLSLKYRIVAAKLKSYRETGPIGPGKNWEYPWALINGKVVGRGKLTILDAGCGRSPVQFFLADLGHNVHGIDPYENVPWHGIDRSLMKKFGLSITYRVEGMEDIGYPDNTFDRVFCLSVIEHCRAEGAGMKDNQTYKEGLTPQSPEDKRLQARMMREMARVLKPGGLMIVTVDFTLPHELFLLEANVDVKNLISDLASMEVVGEFDPSRYWGFDEFKLENITKDVGVEIISYMGLFTTAIGFVLRKGDNV